MDSLAIVIPLYNESACLPGLIKELDELISKIDGKVSVYAINDGSKDKTLSLLHELAKTREWLVVHDQSNSGHGRAIYNGYLQVIENNHDWVFQCDSDQQIPLKELIPMWNSRKHNACHLGVRIARQDPTERLFVSTVLKIIIRLFFGVSLQDPNCPFRLFPRNTLKAMLTSIPISTFAPNIFLSIIAKSNFDVHEVLVSHLPRQGGVNSINRINLLKICWRCVNETLSFWRNRESWQKKISTLPSSL